MLALGKLTQWKQSQADSFSLLFLLRAVYESAQVAVTKCHRPGGLNNNKNVFFPALQSGQSKTKMPTDSVPGESFLLDADVCCLLVCSSGRQSTNLSSSFRKDPHPIVGLILKVTTNPKSITNTHEKEKRM